MRVLGYAGVNLVNVGIHTKCREIDYLADNPHLIFDTP